MKLRQYLLPILAIIFAFAPVMHAQSDTDQQQAAARVLAGMGAFFFVFAIIGFLILAFVVFLFWRIFTKAGMSGALSLLIFIPCLGGLIVLCILAFADWKVIPAGQYVALPPAYPPPPSYPPAV
jgi:hypothetical protein